MGRRCDTCAWWKIVAGGDTLRCCHYLLETGHMRKRDGDICLSYEEREINMDYKYEYGRATKKIETLRKQINEMRDEAEGWKQVLTANDAILAAIVQGLGGEVKVKQEHITLALQKGVGLNSSYDQESDTHTITVTVPE